MRNASQPSMNLICGERLPEEAVMNNENEITNPLVHVNNSVSLETVADVALSQGEEPIDLLFRSTNRHKYPVEALGPSIQGVIEAIANKCQVPVVMAAQSVLATICLAVQGHADVHLPFGQRRPCSLYFLTVAASGDRKTTSDREASRGVSEFEAALDREYKAKIAEWNIACASWEANTKSVKSEKDLADKDRTDRLKQLGSRPPQPLAPFVAISDPTLEGLFKSWVASLLPSLGIFSSEGGQITGGYGLTPENKLKTAASLSELWDGRSVRRIRAGDGFMHLSGRRLTMHLLIQVKAAANFLADPVLRDQGLLSRFFVAAPDSLAGQRLYRDADPEWEVAIATFAIKIKDLLRKQLPLANGAKNELAPRLVALSDRAECVFFEFSDEVERGLGPLGRYAMISELANKAAENAARLALIMALFDDLSVSEVSEIYMEGAVEICHWYLEEALRITEAVRNNGMMADAEMLRQWIIASGYDVVTRRDILNKGPARFRTFEVLRPLLDILVEHGWLQPVANKNGTFRVNRPRDTATTATA